MESPMFRGSFGRLIAWAGIAALAVLAAPYVAAIDPAAGQDRQDEICTNSTGSVQQLATIEKPGENTIQCLGVALEGDRVTALRLETHNFASSDHHTEEEVKFTEFPLAMVESSRGAVLDGIPGHDAIILQGNLSTPSNQTKLVASYLYNGFTGEYRSCSVTLDRTPDAGWRLLNRLDQTVSHIVVRTRDMFVIGPFGIANLDGACAAQRSP
jgi:hypothetical protein